MSIEHQLSELLDTIQGESLVARGTLASNVSKGVSEGMQDSGLLALLQMRGGENSDALTSIAAAVGLSSKEICSELRTSNGFLASIEAASLNPLESEALELYSRGIHALSRGWAGEAVLAFRGAVTKNPLIPEVHAALGVAHLELGDHESAREALAAAIKYGTVDSSAVAAGAALLLANSFEDLGDEHGAIKVLIESSTTLAACPEIAFGIARLTRDPLWLHHAVGVAPELWLLAESFDSEVRLASSASPIASAISIREQLNRFGSTFTPPVVTTWTHAFEIDHIETSVMAAAETLNYLRDSLPDVWSLARWGASTSSESDTADRTAIVEWLTTTATTYSRLRPWSKPHEFLRRLSESTTRERTVNVRGGLVIPGGPYVDPGIKSLRLTGAVIDLYERGMPERAIDGLLAENDWLSKEHARHILRTCLQ